VQRPNFLIIYTDQQRWDALGASGNPEIYTPNLDKLASEGIQFNHYYVQNPICMPSRASFLSGRYPSALGITDMAVPVPEDTVTLPKLLTNYGYRTANIGKLHFLPHANRDHRDIHPDYGFEHLEISDEPGCYEDAYRAWVRAKAPDQLPHISLGLPPAAELWYDLMGIKDEISHAEREVMRAVPFPGSSDVTHSAFVAEQTMAYIDRHHEDNWMCIAGFYSPHHPWVVPQEFLNMYNPEELSLPQLPEHLEAKRGADCFPDEELRSAKHGYYAMISEVDHYVGKFMEQLESLGIADNTVVIFTSDHGEYLGDHLRYQKGYPGEDCISRVPCIIRWPNGVTAPGRSFDGIVEAVDILPTILDCAAIPIPGYLQGESLAPVLTNRKQEGKDCAIMEFTGWKNIRTEQYRYVCEANGRESLYDLSVDPMQYENVADSEPYWEVLYEMRRMMLMKMLRIESPLHRVWPY